MTNHAGRLLRGAGTEAQGNGAKPGVKSLVPWFDGPTQIMIGLRFYF